MVSIICGACSQTAEEIDTTAQKIVFGVEVSAPEARTALVNENGKYKAIWKAGDTFSVVQIADSDSALYSGTVAEDAASIVVNAEFEQSAATKFTYIFASPAATVSADCSYLEMSLPEEQSPAAMNTFDSTSDLILSNAVERESQPNGENVPFIAERISAVGKMTVKNLPLAEGEQVTSVTFTTTQPLAGTISNIKVSDIVAGNDALLNATYLNPKGTITINLPEPQSGEFTLYFSCLPTTLPAGSEYLVTVTSTNSTYTKQAQIPSNLSFTAGRMTSFTVNMTDNSQDIASNNKILYTSSDGKIVTPYATDVFGATIVSNTYNNGQGVITFDRDVVTVGEYAFFNCGTLDSITLPEGLCEIKQFAFGSCSALKSINIPDNVVIIEGGAFLNNSIKQFSGKFASEDGLTLVMEKTLVAYASGNTAEHYTIPQSIAVIGRSAFNGSIYLTGVTIPNGVVTLEDYAFCNCFKLAQIALPDSVTAIGEDAFFGCDKLVNISLGNGLTTIGYQAFVDCHSLRTVTLPASLTQISAGIFVDCNALETVYSLATTPPKAEYTNSASWTAFGKDNAQLKIYVPAASVEAYKAADGWKEYADAIVAEGGDGILPTFESNEIVGHNVPFAVGDLFYVFNKINHSDTYTYNGEIDANGRPILELTTPTYYTNHTEIDKVIAVYCPEGTPILTIDENGSATTVKAIVRSKQKYHKDSYAIGSAPMVSVSDDISSIQLKNICGWVKLSITGNGEILEKIEFTGNKNEELATSSMISSSATISLSDLSVTSVGYAFTKLTMDFDNADEDENWDTATLSTTPTDFYFSMLPTEFTNGFNMKITCTDGTMMTYTTNNSISVSRNEVYQETPFAYAGEPIQLNISDLNTPVFRDLTYSEGYANTFEVKVANNKYQNGFFIFYNPDYQPSGAGDAGTLNGEYEIVTDEIGTKTYTAKTFIADPSRSCVPYDGDLYYFKSGKVTVSGNNASTTIAFDAIVTNSEGGELPLKSQCTLESMGYTTLTNAENLGFSSFVYQASGGYFTMQSTSGQNTMTIELKTTAKTPNELKDKTFTDTALNDYISSGSLRMGDLTSYDTLVGSIIFAVEGLNYTMTTKGLKFIDYTGNIYQIPDGGYSVSLKQGTINSGGGIW